MSDKIADKLDNFQNYVNREISWLEFNKRVLDEAHDKTNPLFERMKFLSISASNLDEFFMIRVASLRDQVHANFQKPDASGLTANVQLEKISKKTHELVKKQYSTLNKSLLPMLIKGGISIKRFVSLNSSEKNFCNNYFNETIYPVLTPMAWDSSRPFPLIANKSLNICALIRKKHAEDFEFATVQVPSVLPRIIKLPENDLDGNIQIVLLDDIIKNNIENLFTGYSVECLNCYRIMRNADLTIDEEDAQDLLREIEKQIKMRKWGEVIRLEVDNNMDPRLLNILKDEFEVLENDIYNINGPIDLTFLFKLCSISGFDELKYKPFSPQTPKDLIGFEDENIFSTIKKRDIFLHHPYESFTPVINFIKQAARDPNVLAIKQTLYRVSGNSPIVKYLAEAAENGKQVMVLVEVKARFDEENNIHWAKELERSGAHVIYGLVGLKTHSKITLVVRREEDEFNHEKICRYVHLGTGNYNDITAKLYTDMGLFTCNDEIGADASAVFNMLSGYCEPPSWNKLSLAPYWLRHDLESLIDAEIENAKNKKSATIVMKVNSLVDPKIIKKLYRASNAGVKIHLLVRGICGLKPSVEGLSENIVVHSIVGRFLEHSRIYYFENGGQSKLFLSSADVMSRNLDRRVEIMFPIEDTRIQNRIYSILKILFKDTVKTRIITQDGGYKYIDRRGKNPFSSQEELIKSAYEATHIKSKKAQVSKTFEPIKTPKQ